MNHIRRVLLYRHEALFTLLQKKPEFRTLYAVAQKKIRQRVPYCPCKQTLPLYPLNPSLFA